MEIQRTGLGLAGLAALLLGATSAQAQDQMTDFQREQAQEELEGAQQDLFQQLDADGDGRISQEEARSNEPLLQDFDRLDHDDDGYLRPEEISDWQAMEKIETPQ